MSNEAWGKVAEQEANALALMLEGPGLKVLVLVIAAEGDGESVSMVQGVSKDTTGAHLRQFIGAIERKRAWLIDKLHRRA